MSTAQCIVCEKSSRTELIVRTLPVAVQCTVQKTEHCDELYFVM